MIIEFFGPPSAGKTTLALALAGQLQAKGYRVSEHFSLRPAEQTPMTSREGGRRLPLAGPTLRRLARPLREMLTSVAPSSPDKSRAVDDFLRTLPPRSPLWSFRLRRYLIRLEAEWRAAALSDDIALFDQAYIQFICSLGLLSSGRERARLARLISMSPEPNMLILVDAPRGTLERRLRERGQKQPFLERLLEFDMKTNLASIGVVREIAELLDEGGRSFTPISSVDPTAAQTAMDSVASRLPNPARSFAPTVRTAPVTPLEAGDEHRR